MAKKLYFYFSLSFILSAKSICLGADKESNGLPASPRVGKLSKFQEHQVTAGLQNNLLSSAPPNKANILPSSPSKIVWLMGCDQSLNAPSASPALSSHQSNEEKNKRRRATSFSSSPIPLFIPQSLPGTPALTQKLQKRNEENLEAKKDSDTN